jgi:hypothetical protein
MSSVSRSSISDVIMGGGLFRTSSKILCSVILQRIKTEVDKTLRDEQAGFRQERSCVDQIATLRIIVEQTIEWQTSLCINFIDFEKALSPSEIEERGYSLVLHR